MSDRRENGEIVNRSLAMLTFGIRRKIENGPGDLGEVDVDQDDKIYNLIIYMINLDYF